MSTTIKNHRNSFVDIQNEELRILMDPWINTANEGSWAGSNGLKYIIKTLKKNLLIIFISLIFILTILIINF